jgi:peptidoglycan/xylan/chitin deacetylase (PgdA/CDA1 family)
MTALVILSLDTEIAWGTDARDLPRYAACFDNYRIILTRLIALLNRYEIPATWAVVAHLLLRPDDPRALGRTPAGWYHAPYLLDMLAGARVRHEVGTHTFQHLYADAPGMTREGWAEELDRAAAVHRQHGLPLRSIVFPRNRVAHLDLLADYGVVAYRGLEQNWYGSRRGAFHLLDRALGLPPPVYDLARLREGERLVNLPSSQFLMAYDGIRRRIPTASRVRQARLGLERAARRGHLYHLWFHPFNLGTSEAMFDALEQILRLIAHLRETGRARVMTMTDAADRILGGKENAG